MNVIIAKSSLQQKSERSFIDKITLYCDDTHSMLEYNISEISNGQMLHIGNAIYKWNSAEQNMSFYRFTENRSTITSKRAYTVGRKTTEQDLEEMKLGRGSLRADNLNHVRLNGVCGNVVADISGREYIEF
jgi:hypothetical protein